MHAITIKIHRFSFSFSFVGLRLGKIVAKIALVQILQSFNIESVDDCELKFGSHSIPLVIEGGVNVRITRRTN